MNKLKKCCNKCYKKWKSKTPKKIKRIANAALCTCSFAGGLAFISNYNKLCFAITVIGVISKFISEFYSTSENEGNSNVPTSKDV